MHEGTAREAADVEDGRRPDPDDPLRLDRQVCFALSVAARSVVALYRPVLEPMGLTHPQYLVMLALWERSPRSVKDLSAALALDPGTLSPLLKRLQTAGLLTRRRDPSDERVLAVTLTEAGQQLRTDAERVPPAIVARLGVDIPELENLHAALTRVITAARGTADNGWEPSGAGVESPPNPRPGRAARHATL